MIHNPRSGPLVPSPSPPEYRGEGSQDQACGRALELLSPLAPVLRGEGPGVRGFFAGLPLSFEKNGSSGFRCECCKRAAGVPPLGGGVPPKGGTPAPSPVHFAPKTGRAKKISRKVLAKKREAGYHGGIE